MPILLSNSLEGMRLRGASHVISQQCAAAVSSSGCCSYAKRCSVGRASAADQFDHQSVRATARSLSSAGLTALAALGAAPSHAAELQAAAISVAAAADTPAIMPVDPSTYTPGPVEVGWQIWFAAIVSTVPFVIGAYEFGKRILIQRRCEVCGGSGLVQKGKYPKKCPQCGGFFPWISWKMFLSANARPGNGGPLLQPRGQTSIFYEVPPDNRPNTVSGQPDTKNNTDGNASTGLGGVKEKATS